MELTEKKLMIIKEKNILDKEYQYKIMNNKKLSEDSKIEIFKKLYTSVGLFYRVYEYFKSLSGSKVS